MSQQATKDPILERFHAAGLAAYGARLDRMAPFGSRARGDATPTSDYDIAVFLKDSGGLWRESETLADLQTDILLGAGAVTNALPLPSEGYGERSPFMSELRRDGREL